MSEMNAIGRMIALATADAADGRWARARRRPCPSAANDGTPTRNVTIAAGSLAASMLEVVGDDAERRS